MLHAISWTRPAALALVVTLVAIAQHRPAVAAPYSVTAVFTYNAMNVAHAVNASGSVAGIKYPCCIDAPSVGYWWDGLEHFYYSRPGDLLDFGFAAINGAGMAAGTGGFGEFGSEARAIVGLGTEIQDLGLGSSRAYDLNDASRVVGEYVVAGQTRGFVLDLGGEPVTLGTLGGAVSRAHAINQAGAVVGEAQLEDGSYHAFLASGDYASLVDLGTLGGANSVAHDINESGVAVGSAQAADGLWYPAVFQSGQVRRLGTVPGVARAINDDGIVVGTLNTTGAFRAIAGVVQDLNTLIPAGGEWQLWEALDINNAGQIVGRADHTPNQNTYMRGYLLEAGTVGAPLPAAAERSLQARPSVTSGGARFSIGAPLATSTRVELFDLGGRILRRLEIPAGASAVEWDGTDDRGRPLATGFVLARAAGAGWQASTRVFVLR